MTLKGAVQFISSFTAALAIGLITMFLTVSLGLIVAEFIILPWSLLIIGLITALSAGWVGTWLAPDERTSVLSSIVRTTEIFAAGLAVILLIVLGLGGFPVPIFFPMAASVLLISITASIATMRLRSDARDLKEDSKLTLRLLGLALLISAAILVLASLLGLVGA